MNKSQLKKMCKIEIDNMIDRMHDLCAEGRDEDAESLYSEIQDWICQNQTIEVMSLEYINGIFDNY